MTPIDERMIRITTLQTTIWNVLSNRLATVARLPRLPELVALGSLGELCGALFEPADVAPGDQVDDEGDKEDHPQRDTDGQPPLRAEPSRVLLLRENEEHAPIQLGVTGSVKEVRVL